MLYEFIQQLNILSILPATLVAGLNFKRIHIPALRILAVFVFYCAASELVMYFTNSVLKMNNSILTGIHSTGELVLIVMYFSQPLQVRKLRPIYLSASLILALMMGYTLYLHPMAFPSKVRAAQSLCIAIITAYHFAKWLKQPGARSYELYVLIAFFLYFSMCSVTFYYGESLPKLIWVSHDIFSLFANIFLMLAFVSYLYPDGKKLRF